MFRKLCSVAVGLSLIFVPQVNAKTVVEEETITVKYIDDHLKVLWGSLERAGVTILLNDTQFCKDGANGMYSPTHQIMIICQDDRYPISSREMPWTPNDYDTLRHESHHVIQDCLDGINNSTLVLLFEGDKFNEFVNNSLSQKQINRIISTYKKYGANKKEIKIELEAFAVAETVSASTIANSIDKLCQI